MADRTLKVGADKVKVSNLEKVIFPDEGIIKGEVIDYYVKIAPTMLPHLEGRPLALQRFPDGIDEQGFFQKEVADYFPDFVERVKITLEDGSKQDEMVCNNLATLVYLANLATITPHIWLSKTDALRKPDKVVFDLDPAGEDFGVVKEGARDLRAMLESLGLTSFVMSTGSRGLHVAAPINPEHDFDKVKAFAKVLAQTLENENPKFTIKVRKEQRRGRVFVDYLRNEYAQTSVAPYALRALPGAPVAAPLDWNELADGKLGPQNYTIANIFKRLSRKEDPWRDFDKHRAAIPNPQKIKELA